VISDEYGVREKLWFFLKPQYWGFKPSDQKDRDLSKWLNEIRRETPVRERKSNIISRIFKRRNRSEPSLIANLAVPSNPDMDIEVSLLRDAALDVSVPAGLRVVNLRKTFKHDCTAVSNSSFVMHRGELLAIVGANGSGKSTTCHVLCGITPATAGDTLLDDQVSLLNRRHGGSLIGWCPQHDILFDQLTALEHVGPRLYYCPNCRFHCMQRFVG
jgi:ABC-type multidrug transport system fused ATPase/permease subunit